MNSRSRLLNRNNTKSSSTRALQTRTRKKKKIARTSEILEYAAGDVLKPLLRGSVTDPFRHGDILHVSDLIYKCARKIALSKRYSRPMHGVEIFDSQGMTFAMGNAIHDYVRNKLRDKHPGSVYGIWSCICGETKYTGTREEAQGVCSKCGSRLQIYNELQILHKELGVIGSIDLTILERDAFLLTEIKSINRRGWDELTRPVPDHLTQILLYWFLARAQGYPLHDKVSILYALKDWVFANPYKEFVLQPSTMMHRIEEYIEDAAFLRDAIDNANAPLPGRVSCPREDSPAAKKCEMATICFEVD